jgi:hypothetical protein
VRSGFPHLPRRAELTAHSLLAAVLEPPDPTRAPNQR